MDARRISDTTWLVTFVVANSNALMEFPVDMLRRDQCFPADELSSQHIARTFVRLATPERVILCRVADSPEWQPDRDEWSAHGWPVESSATTLEHKP